MKRWLQAAGAAVAVMTFCGAIQAAETTTIDLWPGKPPGETMEIGPEERKPASANEPDRIVSITNVSHPTLTIHRPEGGKNTRVGVVVCPGGGHRMLAWDHEGTEVGKWLSGLGVTAFVLKYRVPARDEEKRWIAAVQDAQRAMGLVRSRAGEFGLDAKKIGIIGFSAGGETAALTSIFTERQYPAVEGDAADKTSCRPDFQILIYPGGLLEKDAAPPKLRSFVKPTKDTPPAFLVHAHDDKGSPLNSVLLYVALQQADVPSELHIYAAGGHGFGLRPSDKPVATWPIRAVEWLRSRDVLPKPPEAAKAK